MTDAVQTARSDEVDALRAFAMLSVLALHAHLLPSGWIGVWLFYVISGYVVTLSMLRQDSKAKPFARIGDFLKRRAARILPAYYVYVGIGLIVALGLGLPQDAGNVESLILFFNNAAMIFGDGRINGWPTGHLWTLSMEMQFYVLYGTALCLLPRRHIRSVLILLLLACPIVRLAVGQWLAGEGWTPLDTAFAVYAGPGLHFDIFAMGALLAFARIARPDAAYGRPLLIIGMGAVAVYVAVYVGINLVVRHDTGLDIIRNILSGILYGEYREAILYSVVGLSMTGLVAFATEGTNGRGGSVLRIPALHWIGRNSYAGYLFHPLALKAGMLMLALIGVQTRGGGVTAHVLQFMVALPVTLLLAWISAGAIETPARRWIEGKRQKPALLNRPPAAGLKAS